MKPLREEGPGPLGLERRDARGKGHIMDDPFRFSEGERPVVWEAEAGRVESELRAAGIFRLAERARAGFAATDD